MKYDQELFELCKEVKNRLGWISEEIEYYIRWQKVVNEYFKVNRWEYEDDSKRYRNKTITIQFNEENEVAPLYTSDYLLEKLPHDITDDDMVFWLDVYAEGDDWCACYESIDNSRFDTYADTPLKALLKLTIALHKAGELPEGGQ